MVISSFEKIENLTLSLVEAEAFEAEDIAIILLRELGITDESLSIWEIPLRDSEGPYAIIYFNVPKFKDITYTYFTLFIGYGIDDPESFVIELRLLSNIADDNEGPILLNLNVSD